MITVALVNQKGGVGKTSCATALAAGLADRGYRVVLVDSDPQGNVSKWFDLPEEACLYHLLVNDQHEIATQPRPDAEFFTLLRVVPEDKWRTNGTSNGVLYLLPGNERTADADAILASYHAPGNTLKRALLPLRDRVHFVILDANPTITELTPNILAASDYALVPTETKVLAVNGVIKTVGRIEIIHDRMGQRAAAEVMGIVPTMHRAWYRGRQANLDYLKTLYGDLVWEPLDDLAPWEDAPDFGLSVQVYNPKHKAAHQAHALVDRFIEECHKRGLNV